MKIVVLTPVRLLGDGLALCFRSRAYRSAYGAEYQSLEGTHSLHLELLCSLRIKG